MDFSTVGGTPMIVRQSVQTEWVRQPADQTAGAPAANRAAEAAKAAPSLGPTAQPEGADKAYEGALSGALGKGRFDHNECQTCKNRRYQDGSDDPGVSFKIPGKIDADNAQSVVRSHEYEHVARERSKALRTGREVVSQSVSLHTGICPECGRVYISGGTTRTVTQKSDELDEILAAREQDGRQAQAAGA